MLPMKWYVSDIFFSSIFCLYEFGRIYLRIKNWNWQVALRVEGQNDDWYDFPPAKFWLAPFFFTIMYQVGLFEGAWNTLHFRVIVQTVKGFSLLSSCIFRRISIKQWPCELIHQYQIPRVSNMLSADCIVHSAEYCPLARDKPPTPPTTPKKIANQVLNDK